MLKMGPVFIMGSLSIEQNSKDSIWSLEDTQ